MESGIISKEFYIARYIFLKNELERLPNVTFGRHCGEEIVSVTSIDPKTGNQRPLLIAGVSGSRRYNKGLCQYTDKQMKFKLIQLIPQLIKNKLKYGTYLDIFLTHASPRHIHDHEDPCHMGFDCFNWFLQKFKPSLMIHGHIHLYDMREERIGKYYDTTVINAYSHVVVEFPLNEKPNIES